MDPETQVTDQEQINPAGEAVSPELAEESKEGPAPSDEQDHDIEIAELQEAIDKAQTPEDKAAQQKKLNTAFARMRRETKDAKAEALQAIKDAAYQKGLAEAQKIAVKPVESAAPGPAYEIPEFTKPAPREDDFEKYEDYQRADRQWLIEKAKHEAKHEAKAEIAEDQAKRAREQGMAVLNNWKSKGIEKYPDFLNVAQPDTIMLTEAMREAIWESDMSHEIAYYLGKNPQEYSRIYNLASKYQQAKEIGKIEDRLKDKPKPKTTTDAPPPIKPLDRPGFVSESKPLEKMSTEEYIAHQNAKEFGQDWVKQRQSGS